MRHGYWKPELGRQINWAHPLAKGLVACWIMNEGGGDKIFDLSGNGNVGTLTNMTPATDWVGGKYGHALDFDGDDDYVNCGDIAFTTKISIVATLWCNTLRDWNVIIDKSSTAVVNNDLSIRLSLDDSAPQKLRFKLWADGNVAIGDVFSNSEFPTQQWVHVVATYKSGSAMRLYLNGVKQTDEDTGASGTIDDSAFPVIIGEHVASANPVVWDGPISDVRLYNRTLSADEVMSLYREPYAMFEEVPIWMYYSPAVGAVAPTGVLYGSLVGPFGGPI